MAMTSSPNRLAGSPEEIVDELFGVDEVNPIAQLKITEGVNGPLATYVELSPEVDIVLKHPNWEHNPRGKAFISHRTAAIAASNFVQHAKLGRYARNLGFSYKERPRPDVLRLATLPTAEALNGALDSMPRMAGRFRFYSPQSDYGKATGLEYLTQLARGYAPVAKPAAHPGNLFFHDIRDHAVGYTFINSGLTDVIRVRAETIVDTGIELDEKGKLISGTAAAGLAQAVDYLSSRLNVPLIFYWERFANKDLIDVAADCAAIIQKKEAEYRPDHRPLRTSFGGLKSAISLLRSRSREFDA